MIQKICYNGLDSTCAVPISYAPVGEDQDISNAIVSMLVHGQSIFTQEATIIHCMRNFGEQDVFFI